MSFKLNVNISMAEITRAFTAYKKERGCLPAAESSLGLSVNLEKGLDDIIKESALLTYDSQIYNKAFIEMINKGMNHNASFIYDALIYSRYHRPVLKYLGRTPEATLQIGPGGSLGCEVLLCLMGVRRAYTLDKFPLLTFDLENFMKSIQMLFDVMSCLAGINGFNPSPLVIPDFETIDKGHYRVGDSAIQHSFPRMFEETGFDNESLDFLFSHATFEHVRDPLKCIKEINRILKPGGLTAHCIDLRDHRNFDRPLTFLRESDDSWTKIMEDYCRYDGSGFMNRWRACEFKAAFEKEGFDILEFNAEMRANDDMLEAEMPFLDKKFKELSKEDLATTTLFIVARKG